MLSLLNDSLIPVITTIIKEREEFIKNINNYIGPIYREISGSKENIQNGLTYSNDGNEKATLTTKFNIQAETDWCSETTENVDLGLVRKGVDLAAVTDLEKATVTINGKEAEELRAMEYKLLLYLLENPGRIITRDELFDNVWEDENTCDGTITVHIRHIREKIEVEPKNPEIIKTVYGVGYMVEEVNG